MPNSPIRTITLGLADAHPLSDAAIQRASAVLTRASTRYSDIGYEVQTVRLSTRPVFDDLADWSSAAIDSYAQDLQKILDDAGLAFCSLGTAQAARPDFPLQRLHLVPDLLLSNRALNATVQLATLEHGLRAEAILPTAQIIQRLAQETQEGLGNFRFAMLACVAAGNPFFPAAYHAGPASLSLGLQGASIVTESLRAHITESGQALDLASVTQWVREGLIAYAQPVVEIALALAQEHALLFGGIDLSPAPMGADSIASAIELCGYGPLGSYGTLSVAAALTSALKSTALPTCGYCGLMLPVLEDALLAQRWQERRVHVQQLLLYSAMCGTGLDTIPLPGESTAETIVPILLDVATLALHLQKPLSARLFPVPGKRAGEYTTFTSPYLTNTAV
ncbi:MAG: DUF711 family protein [Ktedonobacteraceae bacterium]|nr:DUF711 family protein [Ktedonobacteraceae bacterium]MBV9019591.1 DUF711 family protein [Ktedonobacteraceae bacterium]